jgi:hypothetical protein
MRYSVLSAVALTCLISTEPLTAECGPFDAYQQELARETAKRVDGLLESLAEGIAASPSECCKKLEFQELLCSDNFVRFGLKIGMSISDGQFTSEACAAILDSATPDSSIADKFQDALPDPKARLEALNRISWYFVKKDQAASALKFAAAANSLTGWNSPTHLEPYAASLAKLGNYGEAARVQQSVVDVLADPAVFPQLSRSQSANRLKHYKNSQALPKELIGGWSPPESRSCVLCASPEPRSCVLCASPAN